MRDTTDHDTRRPVLPALTPPGPIARGGRPAGTITAGWFLREFVEGYPWVHLDVAGTAYTDGDSPPLPKGPAGVPMRLFVEWVLSRAG